MEKEHWMERTNDGTEKQTVEILVFTTSNWESFVYSIPYGISMTRMFQEYFRM